MCAALFAWLISHQPSVLFSQNKSAINIRPTLLFSQNKSALTIAASRANTMQLATPYPSLLNKLGIPRRE
jgi:hypothetical protein